MKTTFQSVSFGKITISLIFLLLLIINSNSFSQNFITKWNFTSAGTAISFNALTVGGPVSYTWTCAPSGNTGTGSFTQTTGGSVTLSGLSIPAGNTVTLSMVPSNLRRFYLSGSSDKLKLIDVLQWGAVPWTSMASAFDGCSNLNITATDIPNLGSVNSMNSMFRFCSSLNGPANINSWNTSNVTDMTLLFAGATIFNQNIGSWNTSSCTTFERMFLNAVNFNQNISGWNTSVCTNMLGVFLSAQAFNQNISSWNTSLVTTMKSMFESALVFNQNIGGWNTSSVTDMNSMFSNAPNFNQNIGGWNTSKVTDMSNMFYLAGGFNQNISTWNTSSVNYMSNMFLGASSFNQNIGIWNTQNVLFMNNMLSDASSFNKNIGAWKLNNSVVLSGMLNNCGMDCSNFSATLIGWATNNPTVVNRSLGAGNISYGTNATSSRNTLTVSRGWTIVGDVASGTVCNTCGTIVATMTQTNVTCFGGNNGTATVTPSGGSTFSYNWSPTDNPNPTQLGMTAGSYLCTVTNECGNNFYVPVTITQPSAINLTLSSQTNVSCFGGSNGSATVNVATGGTGSKTYVWTPGGNTSLTITGKTAGLYVCTATDANGCTKSLNVNITQPSSALSGTAVTSNVSCFGGSNGSINLTPSGGTAPYSFNWGGGITTEDRTGLVAGTYSVIITDFNGCTTTVNATITQPNASVSGATVVSNVSCFGGSNGSINLTSTGGTAPYTFNWGGGITSEDRTGLVAGTYSVIITDFNGCSSTVNATVTQPTAVLAGTTTITSVSCFGGSNGSINLSPSGGTSPYTYNWGGGVTSEDRSGLIAGNYSVTITDFNGCIATVNATVNQPLAPLTGTTTVSGVSCFGGSNGSINLTPSGGTAPYSFNWGSGVTTEDRSGLSAGNYSVLITDFKGCTATISATVNQPAAALTGTSVITNVSCFGGSDGAIDFTPTGGTAPYTFNWGGGITSEDLSSLTAGNFGVNITDFNGCLSTVTVVVTEPAILSALLIPSNVTCYGGANGAINVTTSGGTTPYTYDWGGGVISEDRTGLSEGNYQVSIIDANGCSFMTSTMLSQPAPIESSFFQTTCDSYTWNGVSYTTSGQYIQHLVAVNGCDSAVTLNLNVLNSTNSFLSESVCDTYSLNGQIYTSSGVYSQVLTNAMGCDSIITLDLTVAHSTTADLIITACDSYSLNGQVYTSSGVYSQVLTNVAGCDSLITLNLTLHSATSSESNQTACGSFTWEANGQTYFNSGTYNHTLTNSLGCDSLLTLNLTLLPLTVPNIINQGDTLLFVNEIGAYQWIDCTTELPIQGETSATFEPSHNGNYAVILTNTSNCADTSLCVVIASLANIPSYPDDFVYIFPNPTNGFLNVASNSFKGNIQIYDAAGRIVYQGSMDQNTLINLSNAEPGMYFLHLINDSSKLIMRFEIIH